MVMIHSTQPIRGVLDGQEHHHVIWSCLVPFRFSPFAPKSRTAFHVMYGTQKQMVHCLLCFGIYASDRKLNIARKGTGIDLKQSSIYSFTKRNNNAVRSITCWLFTDQPLYWCSLGPAVPAFVPDISASACRQVGHGSGACPTCAHSPTDFC